LSTGCCRNDPRQRQPDISQANQLMSWAPRTSLNDGLIKTVTYFEELLQDNAIRRLPTENSSAQV
jgi:UDP-glucuronate decarboxylase